MIRGAPLRRPLTTRASQVRIRTIFPVRFGIVVSDYRGQYRRGQGSLLPGLPRARQAHRASGATDCGSPCPLPTMLDQDASGSNRPLPWTTAPPPTLETMATSIPAQARHTIRRKRHGLRARHSRCSRVRVAPGSRRQVKPRGADMFDLVMSRKRRLTLELTDSCR